MEERTDTQKRLIRAHLLSGHSLTQAEAYANFSCFRLASRIHDLKEEGMNIKRTMETSRNADGKTVTYARYSIATK